MNGTFFNAKFQFLWCMMSSYFGYPIWGAGNLLVKPAKLVGCQSVIANLSQPCQLVDVANITNRRQMLKLILKLENYVVHCKPTFIMS
jgi:hypothetical protein